MTPTGIVPAITATHEAQRIPILYPEERASFAERNQIVAERIFFHNYVFCVETRLTVFTLFA